MSTRCEQHVRVNEITSISRGRMGERERERQQCSRTELISAVRGVRKWRCALQKEPQSLFRNEIKSKSEYVNTLQVA